MSCSDRLITDQDRVGPSQWGQQLGLIQEADVRWVEENLSQLQTVDIGDGIHFVQEDNPHTIGAELAAWYQGRSRGS